MRHVTTAAAIMALGVLPAAAQSGSSAGSSIGSSSAAQKGSQAQGQSSHISAMSQDKLRKTLQQSGFTDIQIVDAAYIVHAKTSDGNLVVMYIDPPTSVTRSSQSGSQSGSSGQSTTGSASPSSGSGSGSTGSGSK